MPEQQKTDIERAGEDLFNYAIDREDVKYLLAHLPPEATVKRGTVEYELQILKIIGVGWNITYCLAHQPVYKKALSELYWHAVQQFAASLSETTGLMIGQDVDYFDILKDRLDTYVAALADQPDSGEAAQVIGNRFAGLCGYKDDIFAFMSGSKMFLSVTRRVSRYLEALSIS